MEYSMSNDMANADWFVAKVRASDSYAQNLYASMCNREFVKNDVWPLLKDQRWCCSWRSAGGIVADLQNAGGSYMDWYCSGMGSGLGNGDEDGSKGYVGEGTVTQEIQEDLFKLGWIVLDERSW